MEIIYLLLPVSVLLGFLALAAYLWGVKNGQFDDLETPAIRAIFDDEEASAEKSDDA